MRTLVILPLMALLLSGSGNPDPIPRDYFRSPLGIPLLMAGSFAEMRSNHFHSGLDLKTQGRPGYRIYAAAEGWVSRISVSPSGFGNALYVSHPNGYMTVYAHLDRFSDEIQDYVKTIQYERESFAVDLFPTRAEFPVDQGQVIALSGNTGGSSGPHLHFEVRDERTGWPVNPLMFDFDIADTIPPRIYRIKLYADGPGSSIRIRDSQTGGWRRVETGESVVLDATLAGSAYRLTRADEIEVTGRVGFGIQTHDFHDGSTNLLGTYRIQLMADNSTLSSTVFERFSFDQTRYINAHVDYAERQSSGRWIQRGHILPGNELPLYEATDRGYFEPLPGNRYAMKYIVEDAAGNTSELRFGVTGVQGQPPAPVDVPAYLKMNHDAPFAYSTADVSVRMPAGTVYEDDVFEYSKRSTRPKGSWAPVHEIHQANVPAHAYLTVRILADEVPAHLRDKAIIGLVADNGSISSVGGTFEDGWVTGSTRAFGAYTIAVDDTPPAIRPLNVTPGQNLSSTSQIRVRISDDLSGIASYKGRIDGEWVLFEYDAKFNLITHTFDGRLARGTHTLNLEVVDNKGNVSRQEIPFVR